MAPTAAIDISISIEKGVLARAVDIALGRSASGRFLHRRRWQNVAASTRGAKLHPLGQLEDRRTSRCDDLAPATLPRNTLPEQEDAAFRISRAERVDTRKKRRGAGARRLCRSEVAANRDFGFSPRCTVRRSIARPLHPNCAHDGWDNVESGKRAAISAASIMRFRLSPDACSARPGSLLIARCKMVSMMEMHVISVAFPTIQRYPSPRQRVGRQSSGSDG
jgi:hypothetical protein